MQKTINSIRIDDKDIEQMTRLYRINLINALSGYKSANLIGTQDKNGNHNLAVFSSVTHFGSNPAILGFVTRPLSVTRNTHDNIRETGHYTINHIPEHLIAKAHQSSAKYPKEVSEFEVLDVEHWYSPNLQAPYIKGAVIQMGMEFLEEYNIKANDTVLVLGKIKELWLHQPDLLHEDGWLDLNAAKTVSISGLDTYHLPKQLDRFAYARPNQEIKSIQ
ncbi:MAG: flavin reductase family protein [Saprospiraceae bacterium]|nr:flavin reductase family protein [Saprospiraceae bacterium]